MMRTVLPRRQRGVAVITALLLTTLAITIVASLFWQQQIQVRLVENQRTQLQKQWVLRGALDWAQLILREDGKITTVDHLGEPWAVPLAPSRLDQYADNQQVDSDFADAVLSGGMVDAQSRFNLANLATQGKPNQLPMEMFTRLLTNLGLDPALAKPTAAKVAAGQTRSPFAGGTDDQSGNQIGTRTAQTGTQTAQTGTQTAQTGTQGSNQAGAQTGGQLVAAPATELQIDQVEDLLTVPGMTPEILAKLRDYVVVLPVQTKINVNTASAPVLAAATDTLSLADATALVASRDSAYFRDDADLANRFPNAATAGFTLQTNYFLVNGRVKQSRGQLDMQALVYRNGGNGAPVTTTMIWVKES